MMSDTIEAEAALENCRALIKQAMPGHVRNVAMDLYRALLSKFHSGVDS
jgi:hypothetical protein